MLVAIESKHDDILRVRGIAGADEIRAQIAFEPPDNLIDALDPLLEVSDAVRPDISHQQHGDGFRTQLSFVLH